MTTAHVAIVTGAAGGIGTAIAATLAKQGWRLVLSDRPGSPLDDVVRACRNLTDVDVVTADVTCGPDIAAVVQGAIDRHGRLDGFVSNAGISGVVQPVEEYPVDVFMQTLAVNVLGTLLCLQHALPAMRSSGGGSFVAMGSTSSIRGRANLSGYVASKHAVLGLVRTAALEQVGTTVRVNAVLPGPTNTPMIEEINEMVTRRQPGSQVTRAVAAPYGEPSDIAEAVGFLLSEASRHMNGATVVVDGGATLA
jgi:NAD(P)-dependent dehydrogenase (short-subunit alcohol dehydrogenase family)